MVWRLGIFEFCTHVFALGDFEVVALVRFTFPQRAEGSHIGVQNSIILHRAGSGLPEDCRPGAAG